MSLPKEGLSLKTNKEILDELTTTTKDVFGQDFPASRKSVVGMVNTINAAQFTDLYEQLQAVYDSFNIDKAEGKSLDDLAAYRVLSRIEAFPSIGNILYTGQNNTVIPAGFPLQQQLTKSVVYTESSVTISNIGCNKINLTLGSETYPAGVVVSVTVNGTVYSYTTPSADTPRDTILSYFVSKASTTDYTTSINPDGDGVVISHNLQRNELAVSVNNSFVVDSIGKLGLNRALDVGVVDFEANTVTIVPTPLVGLDSVTNPQNFIEGRDRETDEELRIRIKSTKALVGAATIPSIKTSLQNIEGVSGVSIVENIEMTTEDGIPAKAYECIVSGGIENEIAQTIWDTKPAGIKTSGDISVVVPDSGGAVQSVRFSRPIPVPIYIRVDYKTYDEESLPLNIETIIKNTVVDYGNNIDVGIDVIPSRFIGEIYRNTTGLGYVSVYASLTGSNYTQDIIPLNVKQVQYYEPVNIIVRQLT